MNIALIGNPNSGKTTLFNLLTNSRERTGNFNGVTVQEKVKPYKYDKSITIIDLPGLYSLNAVSPDEKVVSDYIKNNKIDCIIGVVDGLNLERNIALIKELKKLAIPIVYAVNFCDETEKKGVKIDKNYLEEKFNAKFIFISARKNINVKTLIDCTKSAKYGKDYDPNIDLNRAIKRENKISLTEKIDKVLTSPIIGLFFFAAVIFSVYFLSIKTGGFFGKYLDGLITGLGENLGKKLQNYGIKRWFISLIDVVIVKGIGSVVSFLPQIIIMFFLLALIEESGYMARVSYIFERPMRYIGLSGKSVIPFVIASGCNVNAVLSTRTIENDVERKNTVFLAPFIPCSAKMIVYGWFAKTFFNGSPYIATLLYFIGIIAILFFGVILKKLNGVKTDSGFILEMPVYRLPSFKSVFFVLIEKTKDFLLRVGSIIFLITFFLWLLNSFNFHGYTENGEESFLYIIGNTIKGIFYPLGFADWKVSVAIISGIFAKEAIIGALGVVFVDSALFNGAYSVFAFLIFIELAPPCIATLITAKGELNRKDFYFMILFQFLSAYFFALIINLFGIIIKSYINLLFYLVIAIILILLIYFSVKTLKKGQCGNCRGRNKCRKNQCTTICVKARRRKKTHFFPKS
ncbi:MAG: ferrous iron transporter B [Clostridia bacterium]|nr:ferrous iron transporter B [Clostridia bacterium]